MEFERDPNDPARAEVNPVLKMALELGPLGVFFLANAKGEQFAEWWPVLKVFGEPIFLATAAFMVAIAISLSVSLALTKRIPIMPLVTGVVVFVFGALTLWLHNDVFIKLKPTIVNVLFGSTLLGGLLFGKALLGYVFDSAFRLDAAGWRKLTFRWGVFFFFLALVNEVVWRNFSTDFWVQFKVFGVMPLTFVFMLCQMPILTKHSLDKPEEDEATTG
ncbi:MAG: septation protein A [Stappiaceae bacterium]